MQKEIALNGETVMNGHNLSIVSNKICRDMRLRDDAFILSDEEKIQKIAHHFSAILHTLGFDLSHDSLKDTPHRVASMYVNEAFCGLNPANKPENALFENDGNYSRMLVEKNIAVKSYCEHHFLPIIGKAHVAYIPDGKIIGLSKLNRLVDYYSRQPQVQERLTMQITTELKAMLRTNDVAVVIEAVHLCVTSRGIKDEGSSTVSMEFSGKFNDAKLQEQFLRMVNI